MSATPTLLQQLNTAVILCRRDGVVVEINTSAQRVLGVSLQAGDDFFAVLNSDSELKQSINRTLGENQSLLIRELQLERRNELQPNSLVFDCLIRSDLEDESLLLLELHDRERHKNIREESDLWQLQSVTKKMTRQLAHEIKNPLAGIRGAAQLLGKSLSEKKQKAFTQLIINEVDRLVHLADNMLGPIKAPVKKPENIHSVLIHVLQLLKSSNQDESLNIKGDFDPSLPYIEIDRGQMIQVFLNLGRNALQALAESSVDVKELTLQTRILNHYTIGKERHRAVLAINFIDTGLGVHQEIEEHLFLPLVSTRAEGTGLGLAISQMIAQRHQGLIEYQRKDDKTVFTVLLPYLN